MRRAASTRHSLRRRRRGEGSGAARPAVVVSGWELLGGRWPTSIPLTRDTQRLAFRVLRGAVAALVASYDGKPASAGVPIARAFWEARGWILNDEWPCGLSFKNACLLLSLKHEAFRDDLVATGVLGKVKFKTYFEWVKVFGFCLVCNSRPEGCVDFDHRPTRGVKGRLHHDRGVPLCRKHHTHAHAMGMDTFQERYDINVREEEERWRARYARWLGNNGFDTAEAVPKHSTGDTTRVPWKRRTTT